MVIASVAKRSDPRDSRSSLGDTWVRYRNNLPRHLIGISRDLQGRVMRSLSEDRGHRALRMSFGPFLSLIWDEGRSISAIAGELSISKQACSQLANLVERAGYLERANNPADGRSKLVRLTRAGHVLIEQGAELILETEFEYATLVTAGRYRSFTLALANLYQGLGLVARAVPAATDTRSRSVAVLPLIAERLQGLLMQGTSDRGHSGLKMSHGQVLPLIGPGGGRIHEIARIQRVSRQAISAISQDLEALGYLRRTPDPDDRRGVVLALTAKGEALIGASVAAVDDLDASFLGILGREKLASLHRVAQDLYRALHLEEEIFDTESRLSLATRIDFEPTLVTHEGKIEHLANRLRRRLGSGDTAHLAELLETRVRKQTP